MCNGATIGEMVGGLGGKICKGEIMRISKIKGTEFFKIDVKLVPATKNRVHRNYGKTISKKLNKNY